MSGKTSILLLIMVSKARELDHKSDKKIKLILQLAVIYKLNLEPAWLHYSWHNNTTISSKLEHVLLPQHVSILTPYDS